MRTGVTRRGILTCHPRCPRQSFRVFPARPWSYLATRPGRFQYVHTPKHGSWLNLIECAFSKVARTFLRHMRVASTEELKARILQGIPEMNEAPVQFRWRNFDLDIA